jgi:hypothetical protein
MKTILPIALSMLAVSAAALAQDQAAIDKALMAAPGNTKAAASVIKWKADYTYDTLKKGTSQMVCYDKTGMPTVRDPFMAECTVMGNLPRVAQNLKIEAIADAKARQAAFDAAEKDGTRVKPVFGSVWYHAMGTDGEHITRTHMTIAVPGATTQTLGLPESAAAANGGIYIMNAGTTTAHIMTPGE